MLKLLKNMSDQNEECCPKFDPAPWDGKVLEWENKKFIKGKVFTLFFMPVNFGSVIVKLMAKVKDAGAGTPENLCLSDHTSKWNMDLYLAVDKEIPGAEMSRCRADFSARFTKGTSRKPANGAGILRISPKRRE